MSITRKTDYAFRMLAMLAEDNALISVRTAAEVNEIPYSFARSIQHCLVKAGIVESLRGVHGGMRLAVNPAELSISTIIAAIQGPMAFNACCSSSFECGRMASCKFHPIWLGVQSLVNDYLDSVTLKDVIDGTATPYVSDRYCNPEAFNGYSAEEARIVAQRKLDSACCEEQVIDEE